MTNSVLSLKVRAAAELELRRRRRALTFREFVARANPRYTWFRHCIVLAEVLQKVADGEIKRLMVFMPPRHGKSEEVSRLFSAYFLYRHPNRWVGLNSYGADLAYTLSRAARENFTRAGGKVKDDAAAVKHWETPEGGGLWAAGVGGPITGKGWHLGIIDDPLKNAEEAASATIREKQQEWYGSTFYTREEPDGEGDPDGALIVIQCMTGDTSVLMATGDEKPLRDIRPGDIVATYENGKVSASTVRNWINNGPDRVYEIRMKSGIIAKANARHPFLVEEGGETKWQRTATLKKGSVILKVTGANGKALHAPQKGAASRPNAKACATRTTAKPGGKLESGRLRSIPGLSVRGICATATGLTSRITNVFWPSKAAFAPSASSLPPEVTPAHTGAVNSASIIATTAKRSGGFSATTATLLSATERPQKSSSLPLSTYEITRDTVVEVVESGIEDVFDVEIERTENFIANGLVSHNTRWNEEDLSGWLLQQEQGEDDDDPERWHIVSFEAIKEAETQQFPATCTVEPDWRQPGEALCPERRPVSKLRKIARRIGSYFFAALFQQNPQPAEGNKFKRQWFRYWRAEGDLYRLMDAEGNVVRTVLAKDCRRFGTVDLAVSLKTSADYTVIGAWAVTPDSDLILLDLLRDRLEEPDIIKQARAFFIRHDLAYLAVEANGTQLGIVQTMRRIEGMPIRGIVNSTDKVSRANVAIVRCESGQVYFLKDASWLGPYENELLSFPKGAHDDMVDVTSLAANDVFAYGGAPEPDAVREAREAAELAEAEAQYRDVNASHWWE